MASSRTATMDAAMTLGMISRWTGSMPSTSRASISSRIRRDPRSAHMADPPAPAISRAVATGASSRTTASTMAAPMWAWAPSWRTNEPTCSEMTIPKGIEIRITGTVVTLIRNHIWLTNSSTGHGRRNTVCRASSPTEYILPASSTKPRAFRGADTRVAMGLALLLPQHPVERHLLGLAVPVGGASLALHRLGLLGGHAVARTRLAVAGLPALVGLLRHADGAVRGAGQELADHGDVGVEHLLLGAELHQPPEVEHPDVVGHPSGRGDVVGDHQHRRPELLVEVKDQLVEERGPDGVEPGVGLVEHDDLRVEHQGAGQAS